MSTDKAKSREQFNKLTKSLGKAFNAFGTATYTAASAIVQTAQSASELLADAELRRKGAEKIYTEGSKSLSALQEGIGKRADVVRKGFQAGAESAAEAFGRGRLQVTMLLKNLQEEVQQRRVRRQLEEARKQVVDVQIGFVVFEDEPQETRSRLWHAVLSDPSLAKPFSVLRVPSSYVDLLHQHIPTTPTSSQQLALTPDAAADGAAPTTDAAANPNSSLLIALHDDNDAANACLISLDSPTAVGLSAIAAGAKSMDAAKNTATAIDLLDTKDPSDSKDLEDTEDCEAANVPVAAPAVTHDVRTAKDSHKAADSASEQAQYEAQHDTNAAFSGFTNNQSSASTVGDTVGGKEQHSSQDAQHSMGEVQHSTEEGIDLVDQLRAALAGSNPASAAASQDGESGDEETEATGADEKKKSQKKGWPKLPGFSSHFKTPLLTESQAASSGDASDWQFVADSNDIEHAIATDAEYSSRLRRAERRGEKRVAGRVGSDGESGAVMTDGLKRLRTAMEAVPWPLPTDWSDQSRYATLLEMTVGQEDVDDIIRRDIHRTFPGHPFFESETGQEALFNVLKAYSMHDLEVGYCQGMGFVAGVLLMYLPEEPAFRLLCRLMSDEDGANLRRLYLPGLDALKVELGILEWLLQKHIPKLFTHLQEYGIPAVLYASQWVLTQFACPFPPSFTARLVDIMLFERSDVIILQTALAVLAECEEDLLAIDDFERIISYIKMELVQWPMARLRSVIDKALCSETGRNEIQEAMELALREQAALQTADASTEKSALAKTLSAKLSGSFRRPMRSGSIDEAAAAAQSRLAANAEPLIDPATQTALSGPSTTAAPHVIENVPSEFDALADLLDLSSTEPAAAVAPPPQPAPSQQQLDAAVQQQHSLWKHMTDMDEEYVALMRDMDI